MMFQQGNQIKLLDFNRLLKDNFQIKKKKKKIKYSEMI